MKNLLILAIVAVAAYFFTVEKGPAPIPQESGYRHDNADQLLAAAFDARRNQVQVQGRGEVIRVLSDDNDGSRHQRFIIRLASGQTLLVAHNIDLAERVNSIEIGDHVEFNGEYEWNAQGGVIHWTHHDPQGRHVAGWLKHQGRTYQ